MAFLGTLWKPGTAFGRPPFPQVYDDECVAMSRGYDTLTSGEILSRYDWVHIKQAPNSIKVSRVGGSEWYPIMVDPMLAPLVQEKYRTISSSTHENRRR